MNLAHRIMLFSGVRLPQDGIVAAFLIANDLQDNIGLLSITLTTGTIENLAEATWPFPSNAVTLQADSDMGGGIMFDPENAMAPFVRSGAEWYALLNVDFAWIGFHPTRGGVIIYDANKSAKAAQIQNYLGRYYPAIPFTFQDSSAYTFQNGTTYDFQ